MPIYYCISATLSYLIHKVAISVNAQDMTLIFLYGKGIIESNRTKIEIETVRLTETYIALF